jgi:hypothetical protein
VPDRLVLLHGFNLGAGILYAICLGILGGLWLNILYRLCLGILYGLCGRDPRPCMFAGRPSLELT